ncbi:MAG: hypothetical protein K0Q59_4458 [Paenibacillus sp.]|nr:hypothetical protein [Paenibacillus sp.]
MSQMVRTARSLLHRRVKIRAKNGKIHYGKIVKVTNSHVYLEKWGRKKKGKVGSSFFAPFILPLVLFDLLAIVLLF